MCGWDKQIKTTKITLYLPVFTFRLLFCIRIRMRRHSNCMIIQIWIAYATNYGTKNCRSVYTLLLIIRYSQIGNQLVQHEINIPFLILGKKKIIWEVWESMSCHFSRVYETRRQIAMALVLNVECYSLLFYLIISCWISFQCRSSFISHTIFKRNASLLLQLGYDLDEVLHVCMLTLQIINGKMQ